MRHPILLLTGTIDVRDVAFIERCEPAERQRDYEAALARWLAEPFVSRIIFCENSGFDLRRFSLPSDRYHTHPSLELLSYNEPPFPGTLGKGYGELSTLRYVLENANSLEPDSFIIKVTGRYHVRNARKFYDFARNRPDVDVICDLSRRLTFADARIFGACCRFLRDYFCPLIDQVNDSEGVYLEHVLARAVHRGIAEGVRWELPPCAPDIVGVSGTSGTWYARTPARRLVRELALRAKRRLLAR
jgi:hypothetical protein